MKIVWSPEGADEVSFAACLYSSNAATVLLRPRRKRLIGRHIGRRNYCCTIAMLSGHDGLY